MLARNTLLYSVGRGASGILNLFALAIYTRLLSPTEYGHYALVLVWVGILNVGVFQALQLGARRVLSGMGTPSRTFLRAVGSAYVRVIALMVGLALITSVVLPNRVPAELIVLGALLLCAQGWLELNLELSLAGLKPIRYGALTLVRASVSLLVGVSLAYAGLGVRGVLLGAVAGYVVPSLIAAREWRGVRATTAEATALRDVLRYGVPLTVAYALTFVVTFSDRVILGWLRGPGDVGTYAAAYDVTFQALMSLMVMVNLSAFPLAARALDEYGPEAARAQLTQHATLLLGLAAPASVGLAVLAPNIAGVFFGGSFQATAAALIPWLAFGTLAAGVKSYYFDLSFQLGRETARQVWIGGVAAGINVALLLWLIPRAGALGAAWASLVAFLVGATLSAMIGRKVFRLPLPVAQWVRIAIACVVMGISLLPLVSARGILALFGQIVWGAAVYGIAVLVLNVGESRHVLARASAGFRRKASL